MSTTEISPVSSPSRRPSTALEPRRRCLRSKAPLRGRLGRRGILGPDPLLSRDPIGEAGGANLYSYVAHSPLSYVDPLGLARVRNMTPFPVLVRASVTRFVDPGNAGRHVWGWLPPDGKYYGGDNPLPGFIFPGDGSGCQGDEGYDKAPELIYDIDDVVIMGDEVSVLGDEIGPDYSVYGAVTNLDAGFPGAVRRWLGW